MWLALLLIAAAALTVWFSYGAYGRVVNNFMDEQMRLVAESHAGGYRMQALPSVAGAGAVAQGAFVVQAWSADGQALLATSWAPLNLPLQPAAGFSRVRTGPSEAEVWRVYTAEPDAESGQPRIQVVQSDAFRRYRVLRRTLLEGLPIALLLPVVLLALWLIVAAAVRPLRAVARDVAAQDERSLAEISLSRVPDEIAPLVGAFNSLLARLRDAFALQRQFVQDAAHELRTPMAAISLQVETLRGHVPPGEAAERFAQLEAGVTRAQHLLEQLLDLSRQSAPDRAAAESVDVETLLRESISQLMVLADRRRIDVGYEGRCPARVEAPAAELRSVFDNLIDNALRYAPEGGVVDVRLHEVEGRPVVDVVDNGPGIAPQWISRVFDRFFRVPGSAAGGSGLGLAIAQAAAQRHGARIELRNRDGAAGGGLVARVHLPVH
nr:HAMP domain-containing sensor histidine kinase [Variovorax terrae]